MDDNEIVKLAGEIFSDNKATPKPTLWKWYFGWRPQILFRVPIFLYFVQQGIWSIWFDLQVIALFFQHAAVTWGGIFLIMILGSVLLMLFLSPIWICFGSIYWLYQINIEKYSAWRKFLYSIGIILLVIFGTMLIKILIGSVVNFFPQK